MAIWPFGRKNKRHTIQLGAPETTDPRLSHEMAPGSGAFEPDMGGVAPSRKSSKRQKNRHSQPVDDLSGPLHDAMPSSPPTHTNTFPPTANSDRLPSRREDSQKEHRLDVYTSHSGVGNQQSGISRTPSLMRPKRDGPAVLKKRLSKRKAYEIAREQEIRMMVSSPINIPRRRGQQQLPDQYLDPRRAKAPRSRRSDRQLSDVSLSMRNSAASSLSDISESYTFKVNAFSAWTPRPVIRYVEPPRLHTSRSQNASAASTRKEKLPASMSEDNLAKSRKRIDRLADGLDAGGLRELLERDRRRTEKKNVDDTEKAHRKLRHSAEQQQLQEAQEAQESRVPVENDDSEIQRGRPAESRDKVGFTGETRSPPAPPGAWLASKSKETMQSGSNSAESVRVIGNIDDSSIRERKLVQRPSFAPSQDMGMSRSTLSPSHSPSRRGIGSPTSSQIYTMRDSASELSRTIDSERRLSDQSGRRINTLSSFIRRGSRKIKRSYRERFHEQQQPPANQSNPSFESFSRIPTQSSGPPTYVPPKTYLRAGTIQRSQSKFTEHLGDEPLSPPDSRLQSPDIPEEPTDRSGNNSAFGNEPSHSRVPARPIPGALVPEALDDDVDVPLSQSLASIDSEGSWMSGQFLRRISQRTSNPVRPSMCSSPTRLEEHDESTIDQAGDLDESRASAQLDQESIAEQEETWHDQIARRPVVVNPTTRPKSNEGLLKNIQTLPMEAEISHIGPIEEHAAEFHSGDSVDYEEEESHAF